MLRISLDTQSAVCALRDESDEYVKGPQPTTLKNAKINTIYLILFPLNSPAFTVAALIKISHKEVVLRMILIIQLI